MQEKVKKYWFVVMIFFSLVLPLSFGNYRKDISENENRALAKLENFIKIENGTVTVTQNPFTMFGNWLRDHMGFREESVRAVAQIKYKVFQVLDNEQVLVGKEGHWYYEGEDRINLLNYQRINTMDFEECNGVFKDFEEKLQKKGIKFIMMLCCNKESVYPEFMPDNVKVVGKESRWDAVYQYMTEHSDIEMISMKEVLLPHKGEGKLLYNKKYDVGHWNKMGAYLGYYELMTRIKKTDPTIHIIMPEDIVFETEKVVSDYLYGAVEYEDEVYNWEWNTSEKVELVDDQADICLEDASIYFHYKNDESNVQGKTILIAGDSYMHSFLLPLIAQSFENVYFVHLSSPYMSKYIEKINPDYLVYETVERSGISYMVTQ